MSDYLLPPPAPQPLHRLPGLDDQILVHASHSHVEQTANLTLTTGAQPLYTLPARATQRAAERLLERHRAIAGQHATVMLDAQRYRFPHTAHPDAGMTRDWIAWQVDAGLPWALTDTPYINQDRLPHLPTLLDQAAEYAGTFGPRVIVTLPLDHQLLDSDADTIRTLIEERGLPFAMAVGHAKDPFEKLGTVRGLRTLMESTVPGGLIRSDSSAIGAIAAGGTFGAIGTSTTRRHIWTSGGFGRASHETAIYVPRLMSYHRLSQLALIAAQTPEDYFHCPCDATCQGRSVVACVNEHTAAAHSVSSINGQVEQLLAGGRDGALASFRARLTNAQLVHLELEAAAEHASWAPSRALNAWVKATSDVTV